MNFDDGTATDLSGNGNEGILIGDTTWVSEGKPQGSFLFDGNDDYIEVNHDSSLDPTRDMTITAWVKLNGAGSGTVNMIVNKQLGGSGYRLVYYPLENVYRARIWTTDDGVTLASTTSASLNIWTHIAMVYDGSNLKIYVNGVEDNSVALTGDLNPASSTPLRIGEYGGGSGYELNGYVDDVRVYSRALSDSEIQDIYSGEGCAITCNSNSECNTGETCVSPGTCSSECCTPLCVIDSDCDDGNERTTDICIGGGISCNAYCENKYPTIIVWQEANINEGGNLFDIYMYDLDTQKKIQISDSEELEEYPKIYGDNIIWRDHREGYILSRNNIYKYDINTNNKESITADNLGRSPVAIDGDIVVWTENSTITNIHIYNLSSETETDVVYDIKPTLTTPDISRDKIVWEDTRNGNSDIYMYDLSTDTETRITTNTAKQSSPSIYGDIIVWQDDREGNTEIYMYDLSTDTETRVTNNRLASAYPDIYGDIIVWQDNRRTYSGDYKYNLMIYNISSGQETLLTDDSIEEIYPKIHKDKIVYVLNSIDYYNIDYNYRDIEMYDLSTGQRTRITDEPFGRENELWQDHPAIYYYG